MANLNLDSEDNWPDAGPAKPRTASENPRGRTAGAYGADRPAGFVHTALSFPTTGLLVLFLFLPSLYVLWLSFTQSTFGAQQEFVGLANYQQILSDRIFWRAAWNTFWLVNGVVYFEVFVALGLALALAGPFPMKRIVISILIAPFAVSEVTAVVIWRYMLEPDVGTITYVISLIGLELNWPINPTHGLVLAGVMAVWINLPFTFLILYAAVQTVPSELKEAAVIDGASALKVFRFVILPTIMPAILIAILFRYIFSLRIFTEIWLLTGGGPARQTELLAVYLYRQAFRFREFGEASATGWAMLLISLTISIPYLYQLYRRMFRDGR